MMYRLVKQKSIRVTGVSRGVHISLYTSHRVWISDWQNLILTNTKGEELHRVTDEFKYGGGEHNVNSDGDLIYIDSEFNINKLSTDNKVKSTLIKHTAPWRPRSVYSSPSTGDLLVVMKNNHTKKYQVNRYINTGEHKQTIQHDNTGQKLYIIPRYITENRNGDVVVSDLLRGVVVTERGGRHRFFYTGPPSGSGLIPRGICTDALSHILVCDYNTKTVQMIDKDGHFLSQIKTQHGIYRPQGLSYDDKTNLLWVGSFDNNIVNIYRCIYGDSLTGLSLENIKCKKHPRRSLGQFCSQCGVPLCVDCTRSEDHSRHDLTDIEALFQEIHRIKDGDALLMCLLFSDSYKLNMKDGNWIKKYNAIADVFHSKKISKPFALKDLEKYKPILKFIESEVSFSTDVFRNISFIKFSKNSKFVEMVMTWAEKENIAEYCRSWIYPPKKEEVFCWLLPQESEQLIEKLGEDIFTHPTMEDQSIHKAVFRKFGIPMQIVMRGDKSVKYFIENLRKGRTMMYHASGMIVGCAGSGKTTLLERLKGIDLAEIKKNIHSTRGVDIHTDVFDVKDGIKVNSSRQQQRFKFRFDETNPQQSVQEHSVEAADGEGNLNEMEPVGVEVTKVEASNREQILHYNTHGQSPVLSERQGATSSENALEVVKKRQDVFSSLKISGTLQIDTKNISNDPEKKITMTDFAGQCAYYASHQIFLSPRAFFILVLNMEKKFDDKVEEEVCNQEGSIYKEWTHRDYLEFWMKSIHQCSSEKAPVLLVGTHSEDKTEKEKKMFFREIWKTLERKKALQKHLDVKRQFAVGFHDNESIENIKLSIVDVVQKLDHWGQELPQSWAMFEKFFQEKKNLKILSKGTLQAFNEALPEGIKLQTTEDINVMLQFFHDIREILYFNQEFLERVIVLDVQWFADAFKNIITDKNHAEEDLFGFTSEWDKFNEAGELDDTLLSAIWRLNDNGHIEHKDDIMLYMERLGLLAKMSDKTWYVPCMNKIPFPGSSFTGYPASSILCYMFDVLPAGIFHRLVATCMQIPWRVVRGGDRPCIYQTAAVFMFEDHNLLVGMTQTEIQLQVFVIKGKVDVSTCHKIKGKIDSILSILSKTFQTDFKFTLGFKCKATGFCDSQESSVINESEFTRPTFQCPSCAIERKHIINTKDITKYWKQVDDIESEISVAKGVDEVTTVKSTGPTESHTKDNFDKILKLLQVGTDAVRICFDKFFTKENLEKTLKDNESDMRRGTFRFQPPQLEILFPTQGGSVSSLSMDVTIMYKLLRNYSDIDPPGNGWGKEPKIVHISESDDIERIRLYRNNYAHDSGGHHDMKDGVFNIIWTDLSQAILRLSGGILKRRISEV